jgi:hypothetical protein
MKKEVCILYLFASLFCTATPDKYLILSFPVDSTVSPPDEKELIQMYYNHMNYSNQKYSIMSYIDESIHVFNYNSVVMIKIKNEITKCFENYDTSSLNEEQYALFMSACSKVYFRRGKLLQSIESIKKIGYPNISTKDGFICGNTSDIQHDAIAYILTECQRNDAVYFGFALFLNFFPKLRVSETLRFLTFAPLNAFCHSKNLKNLLFVIIYYGFILFGVMGLLFLLKLLLFIVRRRLLGRNKKTMTAETHIESSKYQNETDKLTSRGKVLD